MTVQRVRRAVHYLRAADFATEIPIGEQTTTQMRRTLAVQNTVRLQHGSFARQKLLDLGHQQVGVADPGNVIIARKLDELCCRNLPGHVASALAGLRSIAAPVEDQGGYPDRRKDRADVDLDIHPIERDASARAGGYAHVVRPPLTHALVVGDTRG